MSNAQKIIKLEAGNETADLKQCHLMPCRIEYNSNFIKAKEYFWPTIKPLRAGGDEEQGREEQMIDHQSAVESSSSKTGTPILTASFRGRPLQGRKVELPDEYKGYVAGKNRDGGDENLNGHFKEFTYWNWDELPNSNDTIVKALQWIDISKAIHSNPTV